MTKSLAGAMWALLIRMALTAVVGRLLIQSLAEYYAELNRIFTRLLW